MPLPPLVVSGQVISAAHINALRNALGTLAATLNANTNDITNVGTITANIAIVSTVNANSIAVTTSIAAATLTLTGVLSGVNATFSAAVTAASLSLSGTLIGTAATFSGAMNGASATVSGAITASTLESSGGIVTSKGNLPQYVWYDNAGPADGKRWNVYGDSGSLTFASVNDANTVGASWCQVAKTAGSHVVASITFFAPVRCIGAVVVNSTISQLSPSPGGVAGSQAVVISSGIIDGPNTIAIHLLNHRVSTGSGHGTIEQHLRRQIDGTSMGYFGWGSNYVSVGTSTGVEIARWSSNGRMRLSAGVSGSGTTYADNAAAVAGGLTSGEVYWTSAGEIRRVI